MRLCKASPFCVRARIQLCTWYIVARCALMRQWIQDHVSSPVGANLNRVTKLSNLYLCIHWECNEIGARARASRSCLVVCKTGSPHGFRVHVVEKSRWKPGWFQLELKIHLSRIVNPCRAKLILTWITSRNYARWKMRSCTHVQNLCQGHLFKQWLISRFS